MLGFVENIEHKYDFQGWGGGRGWSSSKEKKF